jgi:hypothetical protein
MRACLLLAALVALLAAPAAQAQRGADKKIFADYQKRGQLDPCDYTSAELQYALDHVTPDIRQYASDYPDAIKAAISQRAGGACETDTGGAQPPPPPVATPTAAGPTPERTVAPSATAAPQQVAEPPGPVVAASPTPPPDNDSVIERAVATRPANDAPAPLVGLGVLAVLLALSGLMALAVRRYGVGEGRLAPAYHSWREARWRAGGVWEDFRDWLRLGR